MGKIDELRKRLFRPKETLAERESEPQLSPSDVTGPRSWDPNEDPEALARKAAESRFRVRRVVLWFVVAFIVVVVGGVAAFFLYLNQSTKALERNIDLSILGQQKIAVGEKVTFEVRFRNLNTTAIESVDLVFEFPPETRPLFGDPPKGKFRERVSIGRLEPNEERSERFEAYLFGKENSNLDAYAALEYRPTNSSARFAKEVVHSMAVTRSPIGISLSMPDDASLGQEIEISLDYVSAADAVFRDVALAVTYPPGFEYLSAEPMPAKNNNLWRIGDLESGEHGTIKIKGVVRGDARETKQVYARIGFFHEATELWSIYSEARDQIVLRDSLLGVDITVPGANESEYFAVAGETVSFTIIWKNNLPVMVQNAFIELELDGSAVDWKNIKVGDGTFDGANRRAVWNAFTNPAFRSVNPGAEGTVTLYVRMLDPLPIKGFADKNFTVKLAALIYSNIIPENFTGTDIRGRDSFSFKIGTRLGAASSGLYYSKIIPNSGPLPPRVGQETTYTITWSLTNSANDLEKVIVRAGLPPYAKWKNRIVPTSERVTYNPDSGDLVWEAGVVTAGTGITRPAREVSFQIGVIPGPDLINNNAVLVSGADVTGRDAFTGADLNLGIPGLSTALRNDSGLNFNQYDVKE